MWYCAGPHVINSCPNKDFYEKDKIGNELIFYLNKQSPYVILEEHKQVQIISSDISNTKGCKHMVVHTVYSICTPSVPGSINPGKTNFWVNLWKREVKPCEGYNRCYVDHPSVMRYIYKDIGSRKKFLKNTIKEDSVEQKIISCNTSHILQSLHPS